MAEGCWQAERSGALGDEVATTPKVEAITVGATLNLAQLTGVVAAKFDAGKLALDGGSGFGFGLSQGNLEEDVIRRVAEMDQRLREAPPLSNEAVVSLADRVRDALEARKKASVDKQWQWLMIKEILHKADNTPLALGKAAIEAYWHRYSSEVGFRAALDTSTRDVSGVGSVYMDAVNKALSAAKDLASYAELLYDALARTEAGPRCQLFRSEHLDPAALENLRQREGGVVVFTTFASFTTATSSEGNVLWTLESSGRKSVGDGKFLLQPSGSAARIIRIKADGERMVVILRDLPVEMARLDQKAPVYPLTGGEGFGFVTSTGNLDLLTLSQFIDGDERARNIKARSVNAVIESFDGVIAGIEQHAREKNPKGGEYIAGLFPKREEF
jgi:hypothetical protein